MKTIKFFTIIFAVFIAIAQTAAQPPRQWVEKKKAKRAFIEGVDITRGQNISKANLIKALKENDMTVLRVPAYVTLDEVARILFLYNKEEKWGFELPKTQEEARELALMVLENADTAVAAWDTTHNQVWMTYLDTLDRIDYYHRQPRHIMNPFMTGKEIVLMWRGKVLISLFCANPIWDMGPWVRPQELLALNEDARKQEEDNGARGTLYIGEQSNDYMPYQGIYQQQQVQGQAMQVEAEPYVPVYVIPVNDGYYSTGSYSTGNYSNGYYNSYDCGRCYRNPCMCGGYYSSIPLLSVRVGYGYGYRNNYYCNSYPYYNSYGYNSYSYYNNYGYGGYGSRYVYGYCR